jgi:hypothetical protein
MRLLKILLVPAALAIVPTASSAATLPGTAAPNEIRNGVDVTPAYHRRGYYHYYRPYPYYYRPYYRPYRYYRPYYYYRPWRRHRW